MRDGARAGERSSARFAGGVGCPGWSHVGGPRSVGTGAGGGGGTANVETGAGGGAGACHVETGAGGATNRVPGDCWLTGPGAEGLPTCGRVYEFSGGRSCSTWPDCEDQDGRSSRGAAAPPEDGRYTSLDRSCGAACCGGR